MSLKKSSILKAQHSTEEPFNPKIAMYQRIDQKELEDLGMSHKSELNDDLGNLKSMHNFSMLQRFRQGRDFKAVDKYKPIADSQDDLNEIKAKENEWWRSNVITEEQK
jgi:hypothetical protein